MKKRKVVMVLLVAEDNTFVASPLKPRQYSESQTFRIHFANGV